MSGLQSKDVAADRLLRGVLGGTELIVSNAGTSQYRGQVGISACGLACLNFARVIFEKENTSTSRKADSDILRAVVTEETAQEVTSICAGWSIQSHLEVDEICRIPIFEKSLELVSTTYGRPSVEQFKNLLRDLQSIKISAVAVITRPPEIVACLKLTVFDRDVFVIFDSHSRPSYPDGSGYILNTSIDATAARLSSILPVDVNLLSNSDLQWQAQLLANYSGHVFVSKRVDSSSDNSTQTIIEASLAILALRAEVSDCKNQCSMLVSDNKRLEAEMEQMEDSFRVERIQLLQTKYRPRHSESDAKRGTSRGSSRNSKSGPSSNFHGDKPPGFDSIGPHSTYGYHRVSSVQPHRNHSSPSDLDWPALNDKSAEIAAQKQRLFDEEDLDLRNQKKELAKISQRQFKCGICLEDQPEDSLARLEPCGHSFCRICVRHYVDSKLSEHRFPILCPTCTTETRNGEPSVVTNVLAQQIGITEEQYQTWVEMELVKFSVLLHCRKCKRSAFVDKQDLEDTRVIACPLPDCNHIWCKACQQTVPLDGPQHSCDGSSELDHLMKRRGWKYCPGCKTPFQKEAGCNHMTCMSPGCNTHFCYVCGEAIIRSALPRDVKAATSAHYRACRLFETIEDRDVPP